MEYAILDELGSVVEFRESDTVSQKKHPNGKRVALPVTRVAADPTKDPRLYNVSEKITVNASSVKIESIYTPIPVDILKRDVIEKIDINAKNMRDTMTGNVSPAEIGVWTQKLSEAKAYLLSNNEADAPNLKQEAVHRGVSVSDLALKVVAKAEALWALEAKIAGVAGKHIDAVKSLVTGLEVITYDYLSGW